MESSFTWEIGPPDEQAGLACRRAGARAGVTREDTVRFCNNPACDGCDVILRPHEALRKGGDPACPKCLEPLVVRRVRSRSATLPFKPGSRRPPAATAGKERPRSSAGNEV